MTIEILLVLILLVLIINTVLTYLQWVENSKFVKKHRLRRLERRRLTKSP